MSNENRALKSRFSPKTALVVLAAALLVVLSGILLFRSALSGNVLTSIDEGEFRFDLCGSGSLSQITVYRNGEKTATVKTTSVGTEGGTYGVTVRDLNFDGYPDLLVAQRVSGSDIEYAAWMWNNATGTFRSAEALSGAKNVTADDRYECLVAHASERRFAGENDDGKYYEEAEVYRIYREVDGKTVEFARYELVYYTKNDVHAFQIFRYDAKKGEMRSFSEDEWLTASEAAEFSLKDAMEADLALHRDDYFPSETEETDAGSTSEESGDVS